MYYAHKTTKKRKIERNPYDSGGKNINMVFIPYYILFRIPLALFISAIFQFSMLNGNFPCDRRDSLPIHLDVMDFIAKCSSLLSQFIVFYTINSLIHTFHRLLFLLSIEFNVIKSNTIVNRLLCSIPLGMRCDRISIISIQTLKRCV